jgi:NADH:ubiquinone oxidoreductase subunit F (NADH-binding)
MFRENKLDRISGCVNKPYIVKDTIGIWLREVIENRCSLIDREAPPEVRGSPPAGLLRH